ncbi:MAG: hypothetical protein ACTHU0_05280 [Kofleriaceae bacterium]
MEVRAIDVSHTCYVANLFAARDTDELLPSQDEIDRYFDRWQRTIEAEPILEGRRPQLYRTTLQSADIYTTNPRVIDAWSQGELVTGDPEFDTLMAVLEPEIVARSNDRFGVRTPRVFNEELVHQRLLATASSLPFFGQEWRDDGTWSWIGKPAGDPGTEEETAQIEFRFGWGDCLAGCIWMHYLRAIVPPEGPATVYDLGGDPLPPGVSLSPNTRPPPS